jgi:endonuclease/exonuclease/phosphatase family metal-dependent hydrolase
VLRTAIRLGALLALTALVALVPAATQARRSAPRADVTVMSRNLYLGADIITLVAAPTLAAEKANVKTLFNTVRATNFPRRARALAAEVAAHKPDVIGLQEVARYYRSPGATGPATRKLSDWLAILRKRLKARGLHYRVVSQQTELDVTVPSAAGYNLRLKLGNAVLLRGGEQASVSLVKGLRGTFAASGQLRVALRDGQTITLRRGYAGADLEVTRAGGGTHRFRFLDPHAEAYSAASAKAQLRELLRTVARSRTRTTIIAGDLNSDPADAQPNAYRAVIAAGYKDTARRTRTCCQAENLRNRRSRLKTWIDHIVVRPRARVVRRAVVGNRAADKVGGLWPSDHAGVVVGLRLK